MAKKLNPAAEPPNDSIPQSEKMVCGIVMPIAAFDGCTEEHWLDVREILEEAITAADFAPNLVSNANEVGIIQKRIIENLYDNPVVVCDVSGRNPNVMFELGIRLAFDKPTIIVKDEKTPYSFDTSPIEHLQYPRDLRFSKIVEFKEELSEKIRRTYEKSQNDASYTTFLKHFGTFKVAKLEKEEISSDAYLLEEFKSLRAAVQQLAGTGIKSESSPVEDDVRRLPVLCIRQVSDAIFDAVLIAIQQTVPGKTFRVRDTQSDHRHITFTRTSPLSISDRKRIAEAAKAIAPTARWIS